MQTRNMEILKNEFLQVHHFDSNPENAVELQHQDIKVSELKETEMVVEMIYSCIHPADIYSIQGTYDNAKFNREHITPSKLGLEGVGKVIYAGKNAKFKNDQYLLPMLPAGEMGTWSKYVVVKDGLCLPSDLDLKKGAQFFVNPFTIVGMFKELEKWGDIAGKWLIITAGTSTLGRMAIRYAKDRGAKVIAVIRKLEMVDNVKKEGADIVLCSENNNIFKNVMELTNGKGADCALDAVGGALANNVIKCMKVKGHVILYGLFSGTKMTLDVGTVLFRQIYVQGFNLMIWLTSQKDISKIKDKVLEEMKKDVFDTKVEDIYDIHDYKKALDHQLHSKHGGRTGKLLFSF